MLDIAQVADNVTALRAKFSYNVTFREQECTRYAVHHALFILVLAEGENQMRKFMDQCKALPLSGHGGVDGNIGTAVYSTAVTGELALFDADRADDVSLVLQDIGNVADRAAGRQFENLAQMLASRLIVSSRNGLNLWAGCKHCIAEEGNDIEKTRKIAIHVTENQFLHGFGDPGVFSERSVFNDQFLAIVYAYGKWQDLYGNDYNAYLNALAAWESDRNFAYQQAMDALAQQNYEREFAYQQQQDAKKSSGSGGGRGGGSSSGGGLSQSDLDNIAFALKRQYGNFTAFISGDIIDSVQPGLTNSQKEYILDLIGEIDAEEMEERSETTLGDAGITGALSGNPNILPEEGWANSVPLGEDARHVSPSGTYSGTGSGSVTFATNDAGTTMADILRRFGRR